MTIKKLTPVLLAAEVEPCVNFWVERLKFEKTMDVPEGDKLGFVMLQQGSLEIMYQTYSSARKDADLGQLQNQGPTYLYIEVDNLDEFIAAMQGVEVVLPVRTTFYGAREIGVKDPAGHIVMFAQFARS
jgi:uncharacterized glyoxalase superfamily protein PhnB